MMRFQSKRDVLFAKDAEYNLDQIMDNFRPIEEKGELEKLSLISIDNDSMSYEGEMAHSPDEEHEILVKAINNVTDVVNTLIEEEQSENAAYMTDHGGCGGNMGGGGGNGR